MNLKRILIQFALLSLATSLAAAPTVFVQNGRSKFQIVTPDKPSPAVAYAAGELQKFIEEMTNMKLPIVSEKKARRAPSFLLGPCRKTAKAAVVDVGPVRKLARPVTLREIKADARFTSFPLVRISRLSVMPVTDVEWQRIEKMSRS